MNDNGELLNVIIIFEYNDLVIIRYSVELL